jgi:hypothetical protein
MYERMPDIRIAIEDMVAEGDKASWQVMPLGCDERQRGYLARSRETSLPPRCCLFWTAQESQVSPFLVDQPLQVILCHPGLPLDDLELGQEGLRPYHLLPALTEPGASRSSP